MSAFSDENGSKLHQEPFLYVVTWPAHCISLSVTPTQARPDTFANAGGNLKTGLTSAVLVA